MKLTITIEGKDEGDFDLALAVIKALVMTGHTSGHDRNATGSFSFSVDGATDEEEDDSNPYA